MSTDASKFSHSVLKHGDRLCHMVDDPVRTPIMMYVEKQSIQSKEQGREKGYALGKSFSLTRGHLRHRQHFITDTYWEH